MRRHGPVPSLLVILLASCAGAAELSSGEGEAEPPSSAQSVAKTEAPEGHAQAREESVPVAANAPAANPSPEPAAPFDSRWADEVRSVVALYEGWGRVDDEARWAPGLCRMPRAAEAHVSESDDASTHGQKLYTLYAMDPVAYGARPSGHRPPAVDGFSQVIVKESFTPVPYEDDAKGGPGPSGGVGTHRLRPAHRDGRRFIAGERKGLYLMMKTTGDTAGTDDGWIYATVAPDRVTVTAVGMIDSCIGCHAEVGDGRLFGLPTAHRNAPSAGNANRVPL